MGNSATDSAPRRWRLIALTLLVISIATSAGVVGATAADGTLPTQQDGNNSTVIHENPDAVDEDGDLAATRELLGDRFARRLGESSVQLSQGEYDTARRIVDEDTRELLGKYVDVAGETDEGGTEDEQTQTFERAQEEQEEYVNDVREYHQTYQEYREARKNGNKTRARSLARELESISENVSSTGRTLPTLYGNITETSDEDLSEATEAVNETTQNVTRTQSGVRTATFTQTKLTVRASQSVFSFRDPTTIEGRLTTENGTAISNETVRIRVSNRTFRVRTSSRGGFSFGFRPVLLQANAESMPVRYVPADDAPYLGSEKTMPVNVEQTGANVSVTVDSEVARFNDRVTVTGRASAGDTPIPGLPVVVTLGDQRLGTARTDGDGTFTVTGRLSPNVTAGTRSVTARVAVEDRAIANGSATTNLRVNNTETSITLAASGDEAADVNGTLTTVDGTPIPDQRIIIYAGEQRVGTTRTDEEGGYAATVDIPEGSYDGEHAVVRARFSGEGTNLEPAATSVRLAVAEGESEVGIDETLLLGGALVLALAIGGGILLRRLRREDTDNRTREPDGPIVSDPTSDQSTDQSASPGPQLLERARERFANGEVRRSIRLCYAAVRRRFPHDRADTHWEFYGRFSDRMDHDERAALAELTETYERAVFADDADEDAGETALAAAAALIDAETEREGSTADD